MKPLCIIGLDGGGTKTTAILADKKGSVLAEASAGPSNFQIIGEQKASETVVSLIEECCSKAGRSADEIVCIVAGLTGAGRLEDRDRMQKAVSEHASSRGIHPEKILVESDARIALEGAFNGTAGIILIAGTGSIAYGRTMEGDVFRVGGWGRLIGDEGSGYAIGRDALDAVSKVLDGRGKDTLLVDLVASKFGLKDQESIVKEVYRNSFDLALLAPLVIEAAGQNDKESERILNRAAFELTEHVRTLTFKLEEATTALRQKIPLCFIGSILSEQTILTKIVAHKIEFSIPQITIVKPHSSPVSGAVLMARHLLED